eukprot:COSAG01_NODE_519_length_16012_cov_4.344058_7_plen_76_part_00
MAKDKENNKEENKENDPKNDRKFFDLNRKINRLKKDAKPKLIGLRKKMYYSKPSEEKKERFESAQRRTKTQQRED